MRRTYGLVGAALCLAGLVLVTTTSGPSWWTLALALLATVGLADAVVMTRRTRRRD